MLLHRLLPNLADALGYLYGGQPHPLTLCLHQDHNSQVTTIQALQEQVFRPRTPHIHPPWCPILTVLLVHGCHKIHGSYLQQEVAPTSRVKVSTNHHKEKL